MIALVENKLERVKELCARYQVKQLELFGSASEGRFDAATSDLDFLVDFLPMPPGQHARSYFELLEALKSLFGCPIDMAETCALTNPYFLDAIRPTRTVLYAAA